MQVPLEVSFRNMDHSPEVEAAVRNHAAKLDEFYDRITACRVVVEAAHQHQTTGNIYHVQIYLSVPQHDLVVDREPGQHHAHEDVHVAIRDAFKAARRQLQDVARKLRGKTKSHEVSPHGWVKDLVPSAIDPNEGYGFIKTPDQREIYFNARSLLETQFAELAEGMEVRFVEETGEKGPQATSVRLVGRHRQFVD